ncbi:MAG: hypothetical protein J2P30_00765 [Actinobacteria bacterium]|nr:hypothetical protein [Actinomycetota bacterium]
MSGGGDRSSYNGRHKPLRRAAIAAMPEGFPCCRCGGPMYSWMGKDLHLDHTDDRRGYRGLAHAHCNTSAGAAAGNRMRAVTTSTGRRKPSNWRALAAIQRSRGLTRSLPQPQPAAALRTSRKW